MSESVDIETVPRISTEILESSRLEVLVPHASDVDIAKLIQSQVGDNRDASAMEALESIPQRRSLFYGEYYVHRACNIFSLSYIELTPLGCTDESVPVFVIMEHGSEIHLGDNQHESYLSRIAISIEVVAVEGQNKSDQTPRLNDGIHVLHVAALDDQNSTHMRVDLHGKRLSVWKVVVPLGRVKDSIQLFHR